MKTFISAIGHAAAAGAMVLALSSGAFAQGKAIQVSGVAIQGAGTANQGPNGGDPIQAGPNFIVSRALQLAIFPAGPGQNGFYGAVYVDPESVQRLAKNGKWAYHMLAKQTIKKGLVDFGTLLDGTPLGQFDFVDAMVFADGAMYNDCNIDQTLVATGDLTPPGPGVPPFLPPVTDISNSYAQNVFATWTINAGSTCKDSSGKSVKITGHGSLVFDPANLVSTPAYEGTIRIGK